MSLVVLSVGLVLVLQAFQASLRALGEARDRFWASFLIRDAASRALLASRTATSSMGVSEGIWDTGHGGWKWKIIADLRETPQPVMSDKVRSVVLHEAVIMVRREGASEVEEATAWAVGLEQGGGGGGK